MCEKMAYLVKSDRGLGTRINRLDVESNEVFGISLIV